MPGHMGAQGATTQNLKIIKIDLENNILLIKGAVPGFKGGYIVVKTALKRKATPKKEPAKAKGAKK